MIGNALLGKLQTSHFDEVLCNLGDPLLALVNHEVRPIEKLIVNLGRENGKYESGADVDIARDRTCSRALE
jgi:hypothetical protein